MPGGTRKIATAFARARAGDPRLATWMTRHHDELLRELGTGRVEWSAALAVFAAMQLTDEHGRPPTRDTASRTWRRVRSAVAAAREAEALAAVRPGELVRGVRLVGSSVPAAAPPKLRPSPSARIVSVAPAAGVLPGTVEEATERIRACLDVMGSGRVPLPRQPFRISPAATRPAHDRTTET